MNKREKIYQKYNGHCAYCGCELKKGWHIDHMEPVIRKLKYDKNRKLVTSNEYWRPENDTFENKVPSCPSCNINKHSMGIEGFRTAIYNYMEHLNNISTQYKLVKRFGLIKETNIKVVFYFEKHCPALQGCPQDLKDKKKGD